IDYFKGKLVNCSLTDFPFSFAYVILGHIIFLFLISCLYNFWHSQNTQDGNRRWYVYDKNDVEWVNIMVRRSRQSGVARATCPD
ncbi:MAG: hypothetical protein U0L05_00435, partial [Schaedlerella sp.]|nr:hypothetical protein [Schaedlerella sp.]